MLTDAQRKWANIRRYITHSSPVQVPSTCDAPSTATKRLKRHCLHLLFVAPCLQERPVLNQGSFLMSQGMVEDQVNSFFQPFRVCYRAFQRYRQRRIIREMERREAAVAAETKSPSLAANPQDLSNTRMSRLRAAGAVPDGTGLGVRRLVQLEVDPQQRPSRASYMGIHAPSALNNGVLTAPPRRSSLSAVDSRLQQNKKSQRSVATPDTREPTMSYFAARRATATWLGHAGPNSPPISSKRAPVASFRSRLQSRIGGNIQSILLRHHYVNEGTATLIETLSPGALAGQPARKRSFRAFDEGGAGKEPSTPVRALKPDVAIIEAAAAGSDSDDQAEAAIVEHKEEPHSGLYGSGEPQSPGSRSPRHSAPANPGSPTAGFQGPGVFPPPAVAAAVSAVPMARPTTAELRSRTEVLFGHGAGLRRVIQASKVIGAAPAAGNAAGAEKPEAADSDADKPKALIAAKSFAGWNNTVKQVKTAATRFMRRLKGLQNEGKDLEAYADTLVSERNLAECCVRDCKYCGWSCCGIVRYRGAASKSASRSSSSRSMSSKACCGCKRSRSAAVTPGSTEPSGDEAASPTSVAHLVSPSQGAASATYEFHPCVASCCRGLTCCCSRSRRRSCRNGAVQLWEWLRDAMFDVCIPCDAVNAAQCQRRMHWSHSHFEQCVLGLIVLNMIVMMTNHSPSSPKFDYFMDVANLVFLVLFLLEVVTKLLAIGFDNYFRVGWNAFDGLVVFGAVVCELFNFAFATQGARMFRLARLVRLVRQATTLRLLFSTLYMSLYDIARVSVVLVLVIFVYAVMGMELYGALGLNYDNPAQWAYGPSSPSPSSITLPSSLAYSEPQNMPGLVSTLLDRGIPPSDIFVGSPFDRTAAEQAAASNCGQPFPDTFTAQLSQCLITAGSNAISFNAGMAVTLSQAEIAAEWAATTLYALLEAAGVTMTSYLKAMEAAVPLTAVNRHAHFQDFPTALLTLFRVLTGEGWPSIMSDCLTIASFAPLFFFSFVLIGVYILLNFYLGTVLENFEYLYSMEKGDVTYGDIQRFKRVWAEFDPLNRGHIPFTLLRLFVFRLSRPDVDALTAEYAGVVRKVAELEASGYFQKRLEQKQAGAGKQKKDETGGTTLEDHKQEGEIANNSTAPPPDGEQHNGGEDKEEDPLEPKKQKLSGHLSDLRKTTFRQSRTLREVQATSPVDTQGFHLTSVLCCRMLWRLMKKAVRGDADLNATRSSFEVTTSLTFTVLHCPCYNLGAFLLLLAAVLIERIGITKVVGHCKGRSESAQRQVGEHVDDTCFNSFP